MPSATVVFPTPLPVPAMRSARVLVTGINREDSDTKISSRNNSIVSIF